MTDETYMIPTEPELNPEMLMQAGDALSKSLLFTLRRDYLNVPVVERDVVRMADGDIPQNPDLAILELQQVGKPVREDASEYFTAIQTTLAACHDPRYGLIFMVSSDGLRNRIYIGVVAREGGTQPRIFAEQVGQFLGSNWPGTRVKLVEDYEQVARDVHVPLSTYRHARALTGIPSIKKSDKSQSYPQSLDRFMRGLRGKPYVYMVVAEPMAEAEVGGMISACHTLAGQVHAFTKATLNRSSGSGMTESISRSEGETSSTAKTESVSESESAGRNKGVLGTELEKSSGATKGLKGIGLGAVSAMLVAAGGPFLLSGMLGMFGQLLPSTTSSNVTGRTTSESETTGRTTGRAFSEGTSTNEALSFGREYLNRHAEACVKLLDETVQRFETARAQGCWNVGVYLLSNQSETAAQAQAQLKALVSGEKTAFEPVRFHDLSSVWDGQAQVALDAFTQPPLRLASPESEAFIQHPIGAAFEGLTTPMNTEELSLLANLPLKEMPGMPMQPTAFFSLNPPVPDDPQNALHLGNLLEGGEEIPGLRYDVDLDSLTRHIFITGITGSGKSNTCRRILSELMHSGKNFLVIEPAKDEYVQLALAHNQAGTFDREIAVYMPGRTEWGGHKLESLRLNPFDIVQIPGATTQVMPHLDRLKSIFNASFPMYEILPVILEEALVDLYDSQGWLEEILPPDGVGRPTLENLYNRITSVVREKGYEERITANITAALRTRIGSLLRGWKGRLFDQPFSTPWAELFDRPVVVNLQYLGDDADKCFTMALLLNFMYEYRQAQHESLGSPESSALRHLAIIEEAHRVLRHAPQRSDSANPQAKMGEMFADILAEIRAYGQGMAIIDQVPAKLVPDAIKNTNLKIIHRLVAADDRDSMSGALALTEDQAKVIARLKVGQAIVAGIQDDMASWVKVAYTPMQKLSPSPQPLSPRERG
ncbi:MAG: ATP-binding protein [Anaerolineae bacterium]|nr:ATP-binding protein [Anaerolineae bacterium]